MRLRKHNIQKLRIIIWDLRQRLSIFEGKGLFSLNDLLLFLKRRILSIDKH